MCDPIFFSRFHFDFSVGDVFVGFPDVGLKVLNLLFKVSELDIRGPWYVVPFDQLGFGEFELRAGHDELLSLSIEPFFGPIAASLEIVNLRARGGMPQLGEAEAFGVSLVLEELFVSDGLFAFLFGPPDVFTDLVDLVEHLIAGVNGDVELVFSVEQAQFVLDGDLFENVGIYPKMGGRTARGGAECQGKGKRSKRALDAHGREAIIRGVINQGRIRPQCSCWHGFEERRPRAAAFAGWVGLGLTFGLMGPLTGCGGDDPAMMSPSAVCREDLNVAPAVTPQVAQRGSVRIRDIVDTTWDEQDQTQDIQLGRIEANFGTITSTGASPTLVDLGLECVGVVSLSQPGSSMRTGVGTLLVEGLAEGPVSLEPGANGVYIRSSAPQLAGASPMLTISAPGADFGGFQGSLPPVGAVELFEPATDGTGRLTTGELVFGWTPGSADYLELRISPDSADPAVRGAQVICQIADDGCYTLPASATSFLLSNNTRSFTLSLQRTNVRVLEPDAERAVRLGVISELRATLRNGVMQ